MLCVLDMDDLRNKIIAEAHDSRYSIYPSSNNIYHDLNQNYWWDGVKKEIVEYVPKCPNCKQVKAEHLKRWWSLSNDRGSDLEVGGN